MERCEYAYRKRGNVAVFCKITQGDYPVCAFQQMCFNTKRFEATNMAGRCTLKNKYKESQSNQ